MRGSNPGSVPFHPGAVVVAELHGQVGPRKQQREFVGRGEIALGIIRPIPNWL